MCATTPHELQQALQRLFGFPDFRPGQREVIERVLAGESVLAVLPTGAGKSLCYQLPAMLLPGCTLVLSPLIALMKDQMDGLPPVLAREATVINSAVEGGEAERRLRAIAAGRYRLVFAAPERLRHLNFLTCLARAGLSLLAVDEAHCIDQWGHDFRPDYAALSEAVAALGQPPVLALTATATPATGAAIERALGVGLRRAVFGVCRPNLRLEVQRHAEEDAKREALVRRCHAEAGRGLVYVATRHEAERLTTLLQRYGVEAAHYHAGLEHDERATVHARFQSGSLRVLVATVAFGLGIDIPDIRFLLHYDLPDCLQRYAQEAGRAGRDGSSARCTLLVTPQDEGLLLQRVSAEGQTIEGLKAVYEAACRLLNGKTAVIALDDLRRETGREGTEIRVALAYLERVGLLRRHYDTPLAFSVRRVPGRAAPDGPPRLVRLLQAMCPADGSWNDVATERMGEALDLPVERIELFLIACQEQGWIRHRGTRREITLERLRPPHGAKARLAEEIARYRAEQTARLEAMRAYIGTTGCRHHHLTAYFDQESPGSCVACDNCRPEEGRRPRTGLDKSRPPNHGPALTNQHDAVDARQETDGDEKVASGSEQVTLVILRCIAGLPYALGKTGLIQLLRGAVDSPLPPTRSAYHGALRELPAEALRAAVDALIEADRLRVRKEGAYRVLALTPAGARAARESG